MTIGIQFMKDRNKLWLPKINNSTTVYVQAIFM